MKRTGMNDIKDILRQRHDLDLTRDQIAAATGVSAGTVSHVLERAAAAGLSWPLPDDLDDEALRVRLYPPCERDSGHAQPDWEAVVEELTAPRKRRRARLTRRQLWVEYRDEARARGGTAYSYSQFCARLKARLKDRAGETEMRFEYAPGLWGLSDFSGKTLALRTGRGEKDVELFVAVLAHSCLIYAEAVPDQRVRHWTMAHRRALEYFGGVPERWIIDNLKAGVDKPDREAPRLNPSFREFAKHHNVAMLPARSGQATDKAKVEAAVGAIQTRILLVLRHEMFFSLETMNGAIRRELDRLNEAPMACGENRHGRFESVDRPHMKPLPERRWRRTLWRKNTVHRDYHIAIDYHYYSVPHELIGKEVDVRLRGNLIDVFFRSRHVASHIRSSARGRATTVKEHRPEAHQRAGIEETRARLEDSARDIGPNVLAFVVALMERQNNPEYGFRSCYGVLRLARSHEPERFDAACGYALELGTRTYRGLDNILRTGADLAAAEQEPET